MFYFPFSIWCLKTTWYASEMGSPLSYFSLAFKTSSWNPKHTSLPFHIHTTFQSVKMERALIRAVCSVALVGRSLKGGFVFMEDFYHFFQLSFDFSSLRESSQKPKYIQFLAHHWVWEQRPALLQWLLIPAYAPWWGSMWCKHTPALSVTFPPAGKKTLNGNLTNSCFSFNIVIFWAPNESSIILTIFPILCLSL